MTPLTPEEIERAIAASGICTGNGWDLRAAGEESRLDRCLTCGKARATHEARNTLLAAARAHCETLRNPEPMQEEWRVVAYHELSGNLYSIAQARDLDHANRRAGDYAANGYVVGIESRTVGPWTTYAGYAGPPVEVGG